TARESRPTHARSPRLHRDTRWGPRSNFSAKIEDVSFLYPAIAPTPARYVRDGVVSQAAEREDGRCQPSLQNPSPRAWKVLGSLRRHGAINLANEHCRRGTCCPLKLQRHELIKAAGARQRLILA